MKGAKPELRAIEGGMARAPRVPSHLDEYAAEEWRRVAPFLVKQGTLADHHLALLENYCNSISTIRKCNEAIQTDGLFFKVPGKAPDVHPADAMIRQHVEASRRLAAELYITPASQLKGGKGAKKSGSVDDDEPEQEKRSPNRPPPGLVV